MFERILAVFGVSTGNQLTTKYGLSNGHVSDLRNGKKAKASSFWMSLALDCLEGMPESKRRKIIEKYRK